MSGKALQRISFNEDGDNNYLFHIVNAKTQNKYTGTVIEQSMIDFHYKPRLVVLAVVGEHWNVWNAVYQTRQRPCIIN